VVGHVFNSTGLNHITLNCVGLRDTITQVPYITHWAERERNTYHSAQ